MTANLLKNINFQDGCYISFFPVTSHSRHFRTKQPTTNTAKRIVWETFNLQKSSSIFIKDYVVRSLGALLFLLFGYRTKIFRSLGLRVWSGRQSRLGSQTSEFQSDISILAHCFKSRFEIISNYSRDSFKWTTYRATIRTRQRHLKAPKLWALTLHGCW